MNRWLDLYYVNEVAAPPHNEAACGRMYIRARHRLQRRSIGRANQTEGIVLSHSYQESRTSSAPTPCQTANDSLPEPSESHPLLYVSLLDSAQPRRAASNMFRLETHDPRTLSIRPGLVSERGRLHIISERPPSRPSFERQVPPANDP